MIGGDNSPLAFGLNTATSTASDEGVSAANMSGGAPTADVYTLPWQHTNTETNGKLFDAGSNPVSKAKLQLNGHDRFSERDGRYFNLVQPYQHHTNVPATGINCYSFALKPEEHQPSGTCNFSRIDNATLSLTLTGMAGAGKCRVYAVNYNVLRVMSGMGGLAYSN